jgi:hypothetical protein
MPVTGRRCTCVLLNGAALFRTASLIIYAVPFVWPWAFTTTFLGLSLAQTVSYHPYVPPGSSRRIHLRYTTITFAQLLLFQVVPEPYCTVGLLNPFLHDHYLFFNFNNPNNYYKLHLDGCLF